jgi:hypothetical protein
MRLQFPPENELACVHVPKLVAHRGFNFGGGLKMK